MAYMVKTINLTMTRNNDSSVVKEYGNVDYHFPLGVTDRTDVVSGTFQSLDSAKNAIFNGYNLSDNDFAGVAFITFFSDGGSVLSDFFPNVSFHNYGTSYSYTGNIFDFNGLNAYIKYYAANYETSLSVENDVAVNIGFPYIHYRYLHVSSEQTVFLGFPYMTVSAYNNGNGFNSIGNDVHYIIYRIEHNTNTSDYIIRNAGIQTYTKFAEYWNGYIPVTYKYPISYSYTNSTVSGPSEAAVGDTVTVSAVPDNNYGITDAASQILVTNNDVAVSYNWNPTTNTITFTMPDPS